MLRKTMACFALLTSFSAFGWDGEESGEIESIHVTKSENYAFRVTLKNPRPMCGNQNTWVYLNESDSNYDTYVSVLLAAKFANANVKIYTEQMANGYCKIGYIAIN